MHVRSRGTIGGFLVLSDQRADYLGVALTLETTIAAQESAGEHTIEAWVFLPGFGKKILEKIRF